MDKLRQVCFLLVYCMMCIIAVAVDDCLWTVIGCVALCKYTYNHCCLCNAAQCIGQI